MPTQVMIAWCTQCTQPQPMRIEKKFKEPLFRVHCPECGLNGTWTDDPKTATEDWNANHLVQHLYPGKFLTQARQSNPWQGKADIEQDLAYLEYRQNASTALKNNNCWSESYPAELLQETKKWVNDLYDWNASCQGFPLKKGEDKEE